MRVVLPVRAEGSVRGVDKRGLGSSAARYFNDREQMSDDIAASCRRRSRQTDNPKYRRVLSSHEDTSPSEGNSY